MALLSIFCLSASINWTDSPVRPSISAKRIYYTYSCSWSWAAAADDATPLFNHVWSANAAQFLLIEGNNNYCVCPLSVHRFLRFSFIVKSGFVGGRWKFIWFLWIAWISCVQKWTAILDHFCSGRPHSMFCCMLSRFSIYIQAIFSGFRKMTKQRRQIPSKSRTAISTWPSPEPLISKWVVYM